MITAEQLLENYRFNAEEHIGNRDYDKMCEFAKEFAKLHCIEQAKVISEKTKVETDMYSLKNGEKVVFLSDVYIDKDSILNAFDLDSIK